MCVYIYMYTYIYMYMCICIYTYKERDRERSIPSFCLYLPPGGEHGLLQGYLARMKPPPPPAPV